jgi:hypothetical protein
MTVKGTAESYTVFHRTWWRRNPAWPDGREPGAGRRTIIARHCTYDEARQIAQQWNATHKPGPLSRKAELESE